jgi:hypothetical protein
MYDVQPVTRPVRPEVRKLAEPQSERTSLLLAARVSYIVRSRSTLAEARVENIIKWHQPTQQRVQKQRGAHEAFAVERLRCRVCFAVAQSIDRCSQTSCAVVGSQSHRL